MKTVSSLFVLILLGSLVADAAAQVTPPRPRPPGQQQPPIGQFPPYEQPGQHGQQGSQIISERIMQNIQMGQRLAVSELLRLSPSEDLLEARSITLLVSSLRGQASIDVLSLGQPVSAQPQLIRRQLTEIRIILPLGSTLSDLEISVSGDVFLDTVSAEVESQWGPGPGQIRQPMTGESVQMSVRQQIRSYGSIDLEQIAQLQNRMTLEGASIDRIVVQGISGMGGRGASVQVELNGRLVGQPKLLSSRVGGVPLPIKSPEEIRSLRLIVSGNASIEQVNLVVGRVRPIHIGGGHQGGHTSRRLDIFQEISANRPLSLAQLLPYETRLVSSITIDASSRFGQAEIALIGARGEVLDSTIISSGSRLQVLHLSRPASLRELSLQSLSPVQIESLELGFDTFQVW